MSTLSIPAVFMAGITFYVGIYHLFVYFQRRHHRERLTFALTCLAVFLYDAFSAGLYSATSVAEGVQWQRGQVASLALITLAYLWFAADYTAQRSRKGLYTLSVYFVLAVMIQVIAPGGLAWHPDQPAVKEITLPFGAQVTYYEATPGLLTNIQTVIGLIAALYILWKVLTFARHGGRKEALPLLISLALLFVAVANDSAVSSRLYNFVYTMEYGYFGVILVMTYSLSRVVVYAAMSRETLEESEARFRKIFEEGPLGMGILGGDNRYIRANARLCQMTGYTEEELTSLTFLDITHPDDIEVGKEQARQLLGGKMPFLQTEKRYIAKSGQTIWVNLTASVIRDDRGKPLYRLTMVEDITDRKQAEEALRESEQQYRTTLESMGDAIHVIDADLHILLLNTSFQRWNKELGLDTDVIGKTVFEVFPFLPDRVREEYRQVFTTGETLITEENTQIGDKVFITETRKVPILEGDKVARVITVIRDITERKRAEEAVHGSEEKYRSLFEHANDSIFIADPQTHRFLDVNENAVRRLGYTREELLQMTFHDINTPMATARNEAIIQRLQEKGSVVFEHAHQRKDGTELPVEISSRIIEYGGREVWQSMVRDITERKAVEQALRESEERFRTLVNSMDDIVYTLDHEQRHIGVFGRWLENRGLQPDFFLGRTARDIFGPEAAAVHEKANERALAGEYVVYEWSVEEGGTTHYYQTSLSPIRDPDGEVSKIAGVGRDITYLKVIEEVLRESEERYRTLFESSPESITLIGLDGKIIDCNNAVGLIFGLTKKDILGKSFTELDVLVGDDIPQYMGLFSHLLSGEKVQPLEIRTTDASGSTRWVEAHPTLLKRGDDIWAIQVIGRDVTDRKQAEEALRESEEKYRQLFEVESDAIFLIDGETYRILEANAAASELYGYSREELLQMRNVDLSAEPDQTRKAVDEHAPRVLVRYHRKKDKTVFPVEITGSYLTWRGRPLHIAAVRDITERLRVEEALRESEATLRSIFRAASVGIGLITDRILGWTNETLQDMVGYSGNELIGQSIRILYPSDEEFERVGQVKYAQMAEHGIGTVETRFQHKDGTVIDVLLSSSPLDPADLSAGVTFTALDITARKQAEEEIRRLKEFNEGIVQSMAEGITVQDAKGYFTFVNPAAAAMLGYEPHELVGAHWTLVVPSDQQPIVEEADGRRLRGQTDQYELEVTHKSGVRLTVLVSGSPRYEDDRLIGTMAVFTDITSLKRAEQALQGYAERLEILRQVDQAILAADSPEDIAQAALHRVRSLVPGSRASVTLFDLEADIATVLSIHVNGETRLGEGIEIPLEEFGLDSKLLHGEANIVDDIALVSQQPAVHRDLRDEGIRSFINVPLFTQGKLIGSLNLGATELDAYDKEAVEIAREVADQLAVAIRQARLFEAEQEQRALAEALRDTAAALSGTLDLNEVLGLILENVGRVVPHDTANIMLVEAGVARVVGLRGYVERGIDEDVLAARYTIDETANLRHMIETGQSLIIPDAQQYPGWVTSEHTRWIRGFLGAPIHLEGQVIGFVNLDSATPDFFTPDHAERLQAFADQAAIAIRNALTYEAEQTRRRIAEALRQAAAVLNSTLELDEVLDLILQQLHDVIDFNTATIQRLDDDHLVILACRGFEQPDRVLGLRFPLEPKFPNIRVITEMKPLAVADITQDYPHFRDEAATYESGHIRSWLGAPLMVKDRVIGMITIDRAEVQPYTDEDIALATAFANQAAVAIENAWLHHSTLERATRLELVGRVGRRATAILEPDELLRQAAELISDTFGYYYTNIMLVEGDELVLRAATLPALKPSLGQLRTRIGVQGITGWVAHTGEPLLVPDVSQDSRYYRAVKDEQETRSELAVPIKLRGRVIGVLNVESEKLGAFTEADSATLQTIADQLAVTIHNAQLYEQVQRHAEELEQRVAERTAELETAYQHLEALSQVKDEFVSNVSHELRTPLTSLKLRHHLLTLKPGEFEKHLDVAQRETKRLERIVEDLLHLSRMDQERLEFNPAPVDLNTLAEQYVADRVPLAEEKGLALSLSAQPEMPLVQVDEGLLGQALSILLTNALNYTPGGGQVVVSTQCQEKGGKQWVGIGVRDTGPGISPEERRHLFERFFRGKAGRESGKPGTGLGLAIAKGIVEQHGGRIEVASEPDEGTTFNMWLPVEE